MRADYSAPGEPAAPHDVTFGSVCSGIEAASVAFNPLGWRAVWLAEIEGFPKTVLAHHYPDVPNLGNMLLIPALLRNGSLPAPDVFCGGTPCQAFSIAGLRNSLRDLRGNLSLTFCVIANEIDIQRAANGLLPCIVKWENVPGVLSTPDNAFGCFLAGLAGEDEALVPEPCPPAGKAGKFWKWDKKNCKHTLGWPKSGCVIGPQRAIAWRVLDAQYFGVAQRRQRVFVVASARDGFDPAAVLFEFDGVRRDTAPRRETGQDLAAGTLRGTDGGSDVDHARGGHLRPVACDLRNGAITGEVTHTIQAGAHAPDPGGTPHILVQSVALRGRDGGATAELGGDVAGTLRAGGGGGGDKAHVLAPIAFSCKDHGADATTDLAPTMRAMNHSASHANAGGQLAVCVHGTQDPCVSDIAFALGRNSGQENAVCVTGNITHAIKAEGFDASEDGIGRGQPIVAHAIQAGALRTNPDSGPDGMGVQADVAYTLEARSEVQCAQMGMAVRRLTPRECERLQGLQDGYTHIPVKKVKRERLLSPRAGYDYAEIDGQVWQLAADGPRYKSIGNSWAIPVVRHIGRRIDAALRVLEAA